MKSRRQSFYWKHLGAEIWRYCGLLIMKMRRRTAILAILKQRHLWHQSQCWRGLTVIFYNGNISCLLMTRLCRYWPVWWTNSPTTLQLDPSQGGVPGMTSVRADPHTSDGRGRCGYSSAVQWGVLVVRLCYWYCRLILSDPVPAFNVYWKKSL